MTILYKGVILTRGSKALELYEAKKIKELDQHMKELEQKEKELLHRYTREEKTT